MSRSLTGGSVAVAALLMSFAASADTVTVTGPYHFLDNRSFNSIGLAPGPRQEFGASSVEPAAGTTGVATQGAATVPLVHFPFDTNPNFFSASRPAASVPNGAWTLTFTNGGDTTTATTPGIGGAQTIGFATGMAMSGAGNTPTFSWNQPAGTFDTQRIRIYDLTDFRGAGGVGGNGVANVIFTQDIGATATSFTVDPASPLFTQQLVFGRQYSFELNVRDLRDGATGTGNPATLSQSRTLIDFTLLPNGAPAKVFLPFTDTTNAAVPVFRFAAVSVTARQPIFIDPLVAIGYDYQIGLGDPNFASVVLPTGIGDDLYELWLWDGSKYNFSKTLTGGVAHLFDGLGVDRFRILGIEVSALLDPLNSLAFITGLTFLSDGTFNGTMTAITADIPLPAALPLFATGLGVLGWLAHRRKRKALTVAAA